MFFINHYQKLKKFPLFTKKLYQLLEAGFDLSRALDIISHDEKNLEYRTLLDSFTQEIAKGNSFPKSLKKLLPPIIPFKFDHIDVIPNLTLFLKEIERYYHHKLNFISKLLSKLMYPAILLGSTLLLFIFFIVFLIPLYLNFFSQQNLSIPFWLIFLNQAINHISQHIVLYGIVFAILFLLSYQKIVLGIEKIFYAFLFPNTMADLLWIVAILLETGLDLKTALDSIEKKQENSFFKNYECFKKDITHGDTFTESLNRYFPLTTFQCEQCRHAEKTPHFKRILKEIAQDMLEQEQKKFEKILLVIQPTLLLLLGGLITLFLYMTFIPMMGLTQTIGS